MALTTNQQAKMNLLKAEVTAMKQTMNASVTMKSLFGNYFFDQHAKLEKLIQEVEQA